MEKKKVVFAMLGVVLMVSGIFSLIAYIPVQASGNGINGTPDLSSVNETAGVSLAVHYWSTKNVSNSPTTNVSLPVVENSTFSDQAFKTTGDFSNSTSAGKWYETIDFPATYFYTATTNYTVQLGDAVFDLAVYTKDNVFYSVLGTLYANLSLNGVKYSWSYSPDFTSSQFSNPPNYSAFVNPSWSLGNNANTIGYEYYGLSSVNFTYLATSNVTGTPYHVPSNLSSTSSCYEETEIVENPSYTAGQSVPYEVGYHFKSETTSFTIPQYEDCYDISWSSNEEVDPQYLAQSQAGLSGVYAGYLASNSMNISTVGIPQVADLSAVVFSYNLTSQIQVFQLSTTESLSPAYTYSQVSGTTNEASGSFSFNGTTPSNATFVPYESATNSLSTDNTNITFVPAITVSNPYHSLSQNDLVATLSGASTGSSNTSNTASPSFTGNSVVYTTFASPDWTVHLNLYGNSDPVFQNSAISLKEANPLTPITINANYSEYFSGESQVLQSTWNGHSFTSSVSTTNSLEQTAYFHSTGSKTIDFYAQNEPNPSTNGLSPLDSFTCSYPVDIVPFSLIPSPIDYTTVGTSVNLSLAFSTQTSSEITIINLTVNGILEDRFQPDLSSGTVRYDFKQPVSAPLLVTWQAVDQYGYSQSITFQYGSKLTPTEYSNKVTVLQAPNSTYSYPISLSGVPQVMQYPISLSGVPTGTGYYQQLLTISNPSSYGINKAGSNIQFTASNGTLLYAWEQSINSSALQVWVKNYYGNSVIDMQVLPSFENLFSTTGYLGNVTYFNANNVFLSAWKFTNGLPNGFSVYNPSGVSYNSNGITFNSPGTYIYTNNTYSYSSDILDFYLNPHTNSSDLDGANEFQGYHTTAYTAPSTTASWETSGFGYIAPIIGNTTNYVFGNHYADYSGYSLYGVEWNSSSTASFYMNNTFYQTLSMSNITPNPYITFGILQNYSIFAPLTVQYAFIREGNYNMPTISSIGTGSVFQANATTTSTFSGAIGTLYVS